MAAFGIGLWEPKPGAWAIPVETLNNLIKGDGVIIKISCRINSGDRRNGSSAA